MKVRIVLSPLPFIKASRDFRFYSVRTDTRHPEGDVLDLATVGDGTELDDCVERDLQPRKVFLRRFQEISQQTSK